MTIETKIAPHEIIETLQMELAPPIGIYHAANERRQEAVPAFIEYIEAAAEADDYDLWEDFDATYWLLCLLAEWRETRAYRPMARLLRCDPEYLDALLGMGLTEHAHRFMASVFDGDLDVLFEIIRDEEVDEAVRGAMIDTLTIIGLREPDHLPAIEAFLKNFAVTDFMVISDVVWSEWAICIGCLGFAELKPLVRHMFTAERITTETMYFSDFEEDLAKGLDPDGRDQLMNDDRYSLWNDTIGLFTKMNERERQMRSDPGSTGNPSPSVSKRVRYSGKTGRNDPCPCGSGRKYKKCCL